jgi:predicted DNA-binding transcriptional regulator AlpA
MPSDINEVKSAIMLPTETAHYTRVALSTLAKLRCWGGGPPYLKLGRKIGYQRADVDEWLASRRARSTSDADRLPRRMTIKDSADSFTSQLPPTHVRAERGVRNVAP